MEGTYLVVSARIVDDWVEEILWEGPFESEEKAKAFLLSVVDDFKGYRYGVARLESFNTKEI